MYPLGSGASSIGVPPLAEPELEPEPELVPDPEPPPGVDPDPDPVDPEPVLLDPELVSPLLALPLAAEPDDPPASSSRVLPLDALLKQPLSASSPNAPDIIPTCKVRLLTSHLDPLSRGARRARLSVLAITTTWWP
jgi:hypothetical protein